MSNNNLINHPDTNLEDAVLDYVLTKLNIKADSDLIIGDIVKDLSTIKNLNEFRIYIKENQRNPEFNFTTGDQRFDSMFKKYNDMKKESICFDTEEKARSLVDKCRKAIRSLQEAAPDGFNLYEYSRKASFNTFPNYFKENEIKLLRRVGGCIRWMWDYDTDKFLQDLIRETNENRISFYNKNQIAHTSNLSLEDLRSKANAK